MYYVTFLRIFKLYVLTFKSCKNVYIKLSKLNVFKYIRGQIELFFKSLCKLYVYIKVHTILYIIHNIEDDRDIQLY